MASESVLIQAALGESLLSSVQQSAALYLDTGLAPPDDPDSLCSTHWLPLAPGSWPECAKAAHAPRHAIELGVEEVVRAAAKQSAVLRGSAISGVEWWLQEQWPEDKPKEHHTDVVIGRDAARDEQRAHDDPHQGATFVHRHPLCSSVTYLSSTGGPTAVFCQVCPRGGPPEPTFPTTVELGFPSPGSLLLFRGELLHCVLHTPPEPLGLPLTEQAPRRTLLVNFWVDRPPGAVDVPLPSLPAVESTPRVLDCKGESPGLQARAPESTVLALHRPFTSHLEQWSLQRLPPDVHRTLCDQTSDSRRFRSQRLVVLHYTEADNPKTAADTQASWWQLPEAG